MNALRTPAVLRRWAACAVLVGLSAAPAFAAEVWRCGNSAWVLADSGELLVKSQPANPASNIPLERIGFRTQGRFQMDAHEVAVRLERNTAVEGPPADIALLGDMADSRMLRISRYRIQRHGREVTLQETYRSFNGSERPQRSTLRCQVV